MNYEGNSVNLEQENGEKTVDLECPLKEMSHVLAESEKVWSCLLGSADGASRFVLQLLRSNSLPYQYYVWSRLSTLNHPEKSSLKGPFSSLHLAKLEFHAKITHKTNLEKIDFSLISHQIAPKSSFFPLNSADFTLDKRLQSLLRLIFDVNLIENTVKTTGFDIENMPLNALSKERIFKGFEVLKMMEMVINEGKIGELEDLNEQFYSLIPHEIASKTAIRTKMRLIEKVEMLRNLEEMQVTLSVLGECATVEECYRSLECEMRVVEKGTEVYEVVDRYVRETQGEGRWEVQEVVEVRRQGEDARFQSSLPNRLLLWHGRPLSAYVSLLSRGVQLPSPEVPETGYLYGKGLYFTDMMSKAAASCSPSRLNPTICLLLCEVACGDYVELLHFDPHAMELPEGKSSVKSCGKLAPMSHISLEGVRVPCGEVRETGFHGSQRYNDYVVYDESQVKIRYVVKEKLAY